MKALSFELSGKTAFFKKPDVNQYAYFTYNNIHKPALLGLLGAVEGYGGYTLLHEQKKVLQERMKHTPGKAKKILQNELTSLNERYPEFYEKLQNLKIAIRPLSPNGYFSKKIQVFNNSVGYASFEAGGNLIVREQWLENPAWHIVIKEDDSEVYSEIKKKFLEQKAVFIPYLGKNDHPAKIHKVAEVDLQPYIPGQRISSLFMEKEVHLSTHPPRHELSYYFKEFAPVRLQKEYHFYEYESMVYCNHKVESCAYDEVYAMDEENYFFI